MKTKLSTLTLTFVLMLGLAGVSSASPNKYADYRAQFEAAKQASASATVAQHGNKYCRANMERFGLNNTSKTN